MITIFARVVDHIKTVRMKWLVLSLLLLGVVASAIFAPLVFATNDKIDSSSRVVTFYYDDKEKTIITKGKTVSDALADAEIEIGNNDKVTPAVKSNLGSGMTVVNVKRARPVTVIDSDGRRSRVVTAETDNATIAKQANMAMKSHDTAKVSSIGDFISDGGIGQQMTIARAKTVNLVLYGQSLSLRTQKATVRDMLKEANIKLSPDDTASINLDTKVSEGMSFQIWRNGIQTIEQTEDVPFETQTVNDATKRTGYSEIQTVGQNGKKTVIYQVNMQNGVEIGRQKISEVITVPAVTQVEIKGTKVELPPGSHEDWMRMAGISSDDFGYVNFLVSRESGWNPNSVNKSSGACGLPQALPCSKLGSNWNDPIHALQWMSSYVNRYGGWKGAYDFWQSHHWY